MGFGYLIAGFILLFNPVVHVVDVIPDAIGFFLIAAGLKKLSYLVGELKQAKTWFLRLAFVETAKIFCIFFIPYTSGSAKTLMAFVFGVIELLMFIPANINLFEGLSYAAMWYNGTAFYAKKTKRKGKKVVELQTETQRFITFFYVFRVCATLIPELTELQMYDYVGEVSAFSVRLTYYKTALYVILGIACIILGIIYIVKVSRFFGSLRNDKAFIECMNNKFERDILPCETLFISERMKLCLLLTVISCITSFVLRFDGVNVFVGAISSGLLIAASAILLKYSKYAYIVIGLSAVRSVLSIFTLISQYRFFSEYSVEAVGWRDKPHDMYYSMCGFITAENIAALCAFLMFAAILLTVIKKHLAVCGMKEENAMLSKSVKDAEAFNRFGAKILLLVVFAIINYVLAIAYPYLAVNSELIGVVTSAVNILFFGYSIYAMSVISNELYEKEIEYYV